jgi:hypothetical protein
MEHNERREFIKMSALAFAGIAFQLNSISTFAQQSNLFQGRSINPGLNWDAFLSKITQLAKEQHLPNWDQNGYIKNVQNLLLQCQFPEFENVKKEFSSYKDETKNWFEHDLLHKEINFQVSLLQFEKGEYISHHNHPDMCGVINMVTGNALVKNYSLHKELEKTKTQSYNGQTFTLKSCVLEETKKEILTPGNTSILTSTKGNIHSLMPNEFTQLVDVFTPAYNEKNEAASIWYQVNEEVNFENNSNLFEAEYAV